MALTCKQQQERIEETVIQPIDRWVQQQEQRCRSEPCIWWLFCLNVLLCWIVYTVVRVVEWITVLVVRWVYRVVCTLVLLVVGLVALFFGNGDILATAARDLWELTKDAFYAATGAIIFAALRLVDVVQSVLGVQAKKRPLTKNEISVLSPIYRNALPYGLIEIVAGPAGLLTPTGRALTMGYTIYLPSASDETLVHECLHVWQFQAEGFRYIGNSAFNQLDGRIFSPGYSPYEWQSHLDAGESWYTLKSAEAQAKFISDLFRSGAFIPLTGSPVAGNGAFFREDPAAGSNSFQVGTTSYTSQANDAWRIIRTG